MDNALIETCFNRLQAAEIECHKEFGTIYVKIENSPEHLRISCGSGNPKVASFRYGIVYGPFTSLSACGGVIFFENQGVYSAGVTVKSDKPKPNSAAMAWLQRN